MVFSPLVWLGSGIQSSIFPTIPSLVNLFLSLLVTWKAISISCWMGPSFSSWNWWVIVLEKFPLKAKGVEGMLVEEVIDVWCRGCCWYATTRRSKLYYYCWKCEYFLAKARWWYGLPLYKCTIDNTLCNKFFSRKWLAPFHRLDAKFSLIFFTSLLEGWI